MNASEDTDTIEWVRTLAELPDEPEPSTEVVLHHPGYTQTEWDRRIRVQLEAADYAVDHLAASPGKTDSVLVRDVLLGLGHERAAREHMAATAGEDTRSIYAAMWDEKTPRNRRLSEGVPVVGEPKAIEPTRVSPPRRRRKPGGTS